jgi:hypothetical protein
MNTRDYVFAFVGNCTFRSDIADSVRDASGGALQITPLDGDLFKIAAEPLDLQGNVPTLLRVDSGRPSKAWTGWPMGFELAKILGLNRTFSVLRELGRLRHRDSVIGVERRAVATTKLSQYWVPRPSRCSALSRAKQRGRAVAEDRHGGGEAFRQSGSSRHGHRLLLACVLADGRADHGGDGAHGGSAEPGVGVLAGGVPDDAGA